ncbi:MAG: hypothetical protein OEV76_04620, partial [Anaerolineae bacterium]|nr:hypothetical protein [Anaerolineae bacterium]
MSDFFEDGLDAARAEARANDETEEDASSSQEALAGDPEENLTEELSGAEDSDEGEDDIDLRVDTLLELEGM